MNSPHPPHPGQPPGGWPAEWGEHTGTRSHRGVSLS